MKTVIKKTTSTGHEDYFIVKDVIELNRGMIEGTVVEHHWNDLSNPATDYRVGERIKARKFKTYKIN